MAIRDLIVHLDHSPAGKARMQYAFDLAETHGAHITGVGFSPMGLIPYYGAPDLFIPAPVEYFDKLRQEARKALDEFASAGTKRGLSIETRLIEGATIDFPSEMTVHARHADLSLTGQPDEAQMAGGQHALIEELLFNSGRPAIVVPKVGSYTARPKTVLVAWDASGAAARAVNDALPVLKQAAKVIVLVVLGARTGAHGDVPGADIALHLSRHGVEVEAKSVPGGADVGIAELLLSQTSDTGADMIVMGGYHHSRLREFVFGGVTRTILDSMTVPVLMAH